MSTLVFFDVETVDVPDNRQGDIIIQLAAVIKVGDSLSTLNTLANPGQASSAAAMEAHGIVPSKIEGLPSISQTQIYQQFKMMNTIPDLYFVCYNKKCDEVALKRVGIDISAKVIDIWRVVKLINDKLGLQWEYTRLGYMIYANELYTRRHPAQAELQAHDALFDSYDLMILFEWLQEKFGMTIEQAVHITNNPILYSKIPFGTHKGKSFGDISQSQLSWMYDNVDDPDIKFTISHIK